MAFASGQNLLMSFSNSSEQLVLHVEQFIARGGNADLYKVKLLQQHTTSTAAPAVSAEMDPSTAAGERSRLAAELQVIIAELNKGVAQSVGMVQLGQCYALKVARCLDSYPDDVTSGKCNRAYVLETSYELRYEWQVLREFCRCRSIINAYKLGQVTAAGPSQSNTAGLDAGAAASAIEQQKQQQQRQQHEPGEDFTAAATLGMPCMLLEYADGGCAWDMVYSQHGKPTPLPADEARRAMQGVAYALHAMHKASYIHRDVKLHNVLKITGELGSR
jgi:serine/threonine protein kinase